MPAIYSPSRSLRPETSYDLPVQRRLTPARRIRRDYLEMTKPDPMSPEGLTSAGVSASLLEYLHACPICRDLELAHYCRVPSLFNPGEFIHYERCHGCGTVLRNPRLPAEYRETRYQEGEISDDDIRLKPENQAHYRYMMRLLERLLPTGAGRRLLDFGCGAGGFLLAAQQCGFEVMGLELNRGLATHVEENLGIPTFQGLVTDPRFANERFEIIISSQVFEHLVDPRATLMELREHLEAPGLLLIEVPNQNHIKERLRRGAVMDDSHLFYFSGRSLARMLEAAGFRVVKIEEGLRTYRIFRDHDGRFSDRVHDIGQRLFSALRIKTGLSVIARLR